jgi:RHS repeat-associated protein
VVTNHAGNIYERFEYTPYGEVWIAWANSGVVHNEMLPFRFTGKELDEETGLYYYGARYLDPRVSRWLSADPALGDYLPSAPVNEEARRRNGNLPGMGGVFNYVNLHAYHYAGNNPVKYIDPDGRDINYIQGEGVTDEQFVSVKATGEEIKHSETEAGRRYRELDKPGISVNVYVNSGGESNAEPTNWEWATNGKGSNSVVNINVNDPGNYKGEEVAKNLNATLVHEISGHAYDYYQGSSPYNGSVGKGSWSGRFRSEQNAVAMENEYRASKGLPQREYYDGNWPMPIYNKTTGDWSVTFRGIKSKWWR